MRKTNYNIIFLRFLAIIIVIFGHSIIIYDPNWGIFSSSIKSNILVFFKHVINIIQMPIWFSIAGYLFYNTIKRNKSFILVFLDKIRKLIIPFFIVGILYLIPIRLLIGYPNYVNHSILYNILKNLVLGFDNGHLWYLPTLFIMFVVFYFYKYNKYIVIDIVLLLMLIVFNTIPINIPYYISYIFTYAVFFYEGILFNKYISNSKYNSLFLLLLIILIGIFSRLSITSKCILVIVQLLFILFLYKLDFTKLGKNKIINAISNNSYGMYLFHSPLIYFSFKYVANINPILMICINFILFGTLSFGLSYFLKKTKLKFIVGE